MWENPNILIALLAVPFIILLLVFEHFKRKATCMKYASKQAFSLLSSENTRINIIRRVSLVFAYIFFVLALAGPRWGLITTKVEERGVSIVIALDVSASMFCEDIKPNRFKASMEKIKILASILKAEKFGLVGFAGKAFTVCPVTGDISSFQVFLNEIDADVIPYPGTDIADALKKAKESFAKDMNSKVIILFTDGENLQGNPETILPTLKGINVFVVGVGTPEGEPIPIRDEAGNIKEYKKGDGGRGETVISRLDETMLLKIANSTGGKYFPYTSANSDIERMADDINSMEKDKFGSESAGNSLEKRYYIPLTAAFFFVFLDFILPFVFRKKTIYDSFGALAILIIFFTARPSQASNLSKGNRAFKNKDYFKAEKCYKKELEKKSEPEIYYNLGNTYYCEQKNDEAEKQYKKASTFGDIDFKGDLFYNMGNNYYRKGDFGASAESYRRALSVNPSDEDALHNLELALKKKRDKNKSDKGAGSQNKDKKKKGSMSKEDIERLLNVVGNMEKNKNKKRQEKMPDVRKDW
ncbi:MAG: hypothetical protein COT16_01590 [Elusimicrobia bacterium CG08_land_8_20_14_0_20_44_26]|nr:MAG: hypothetical protein COT16_01590 [Elusimicrobia bacterium CG08_land_8_20_14_0_20_44_26]